MFPMPYRSPVPQTRIAIEAAAQRIAQSAVHTDRSREMLATVYRLITMYPRCKTAAAVENLTYQLETRLETVGMLLSEQHGHVDGALINLSLAAESSERDCAWADRARVQDLNAGVAS